MVGEKGGSCGPLHAKLCVCFQTHLPPHNNDAPIPRPCNREAFPSQLHGRHAALRPHVPEPAGAVRGDGGEFGLFGRVPSYALDARRVPAQFGAVFHLGLFGVPDAQDAVGGTGGDVGAGGGPGYGADAGERRKMGLVRKDCTGKGRACGKGTEEEIGGGWGGGGEGLLGEEGLTCGSLGLEMQGRGMFAS